MLSVKNDIDIFAEKNSFLLRPQLLTTIECLEKWKPLPSRRIAQKELGIAE